MNMKFSRMIHTIDTHTGGNPTRTIISGAPELPGKTMTEKMDYMSRHYDHFRTAMMLEPRGHEVMSGCVLTPPCDERADVGVVFIETGGYLPMCGHDTIGLCTALVEGGLYPESTELLRLDTPAGLVEARLVIEAGKVREVSFTNIPSFLYQQEVRVELEGHGEIPVDIAYGGNFYGLVDARPLGLELQPQRGAELIRTAIAIREAINRKLEIVHPEIPLIRGLTHIEFYSDPVSPQAHCRNTVVVPPGGIDRSPCGTGTSAKIAVLYARKEIGLGEEFVHESIVGSLFRAVVVEESSVGGYPAIVPRISGSAWITGFHQFVWQEQDALNRGFFLK